ncbi:hypothetical protein ACTD5D_39930 [Nocardia takedensis]|uniref:hypothetical protein n=1 Tax=Nocardia takedensis TaxID=259390 RepID=UPI003F76CA43
MTLTLARVRELHELPLPVSPTTGDIISAPEWNARWRRYELEAEQMGALATAARTALSTAPGETAEQRRRRRVLTAAADQLEFLAYDTARAHATIPAPGTPDPYDQPYTPPALEPTVIELDIPDDPEAITLFDLPTTSTPDPEPAPAQSASPNATSTGRTVLDVDAAQPDSEAPVPCEPRSGDGSAPSERAVGGAARSRDRAPTSKTRSRRTHPRAASASNTVLRLRRTSPARQGACPPRPYAIGGPRTGPPHERACWEGGRDRGNALTLDPGGTGAPRPSPQKPDAAAAASAPRPGTVLARAGVAQR